MTSLQIQRIKSYSKRFFELYWKFKHKKHKHTQNSASNHDIDAVCVCQPDIIAVCTTQQLACLRVRIQIVKARRHTVPMFRLTAYAVSVHGA